jgi:two-component system, chemotaxis family, chemotaxis protein CheY
MSRILLIEDEDAQRAAVRAQLVALGHTVEEAANGKIGLARFHATPPDLVITDLVMPEMEGLETIRALKQANPTVKIIAMSGGGANPAGTYLRAAQQLGASVGLAKPFSKHELEAALAKLLPNATPPTSPIFLVLDDNATSRYMNRSLLETEFPRSQVIECGTVRDAIAVSNRVHLDAVITDHHLGESDGAEFVAKLRAHGATCPVVMVTNSSDPKVHERAYAAGAARVFHDGKMDFTGYLRQKLQPEGSSE